MGKSKNLGKPVSGNDSDLPRGGYTSDCTNLVFHVNFKCENANLRDEAKLESLVSRVSLQVCIAVILQRGFDRNQRLNYVW
jgi:hypothetical protein